MRLCYKKSVSKRIPHILLSFWFHPPHCLSVLTLFSVSLSSRCVEGKCCSCLSSGRCFEGFHANQRYERMVCLVIQVPCKRSSSYSSTCRQIQRRVGGGGGGGTGANVFCFLSSVPLLPPATMAVFVSYMSYIYSFFSNSVSPVRACLSIWLEKFRGIPKEDDRGPLSIQSSLGVGGGGEWYGRMVSEPDTWFSPGSPRLSYKHRRNNKWNGK